jgi:hypothetical protein
MAPLLRLTVGRQARSLSSYAPKRPCPLTRVSTQDDPQDPAELDFIELFALVLTLASMVASPITRDGRRTHQGIKPRKYANLTCAICGKLRYVVHCVAERPCFTVDFRAGCPDLCEVWEEERVEGQVRVFRLSCRGGWDQINADAYRPPFCPAIRPFGQWMLHCNFVPVESRRWMEAASYSLSGLQYLQLKRMNCVDLTHFIDSLPGFTKVRMVEDDHGSHHLYHGKAVVSFSWIPNWAWATYQRIQYLQLDSSFRASYPFVYCVPQGIVCNEAVPLALIVNVSETKSIYQWFLDDLAFSQKLLPRDLPKKPVLSDQGKALNAFCADNELPHYLCHRHLIENFGANSAIGLLAAKALRETSIRSYQSHRPQYLADAAALLEIRAVDEEDFEKFSAFLSQDFPHGIWHRMEHGISSCTNHAERFHGVVNQHLPQRSPLPVRLAIIRDQMQAKWQTFGTRRVDQMRELLRHLREYKAPCTPECHDIDCIEFIEIMKYRFGVSSFPCKHTAHQPE